MTTNALSVSSTRSEAERTIPGLPPVAGSNIGGSFCYPCQALLPPTPKTPASAAPATSVPASQTTKVNAESEADSRPKALNPDPSPPAPAQPGVESAERNGAANGTLPPGRSGEEGGAAEKGNEKKEKKDKKEKPPAQKKEVDTGISVVDIRVGEVKKVWKHPSADT